MLYVFLSLIIIIYATLVFFFIKNLHQLSFIQKISNNHLSWIVTIILVVIPFLFFNLVDMLAIIIHFFLFLGLIKLLTIKRRSSLNNQNIFAIICTILYLSIGAYLDYHVFETTYTINTTKELGSDTFRIIQISDSHLGTTFNGDGFKKHLEKIKSIKADLVVITGDFVDDSTTKEDMIKGCHALSILTPQYGSYFVYGNHDEGYYNSRDFSSADLEIELEKNNVTILKDKVKNINNYIYLVGRKDKGMKRLSIQELVADIPKDKYVISLNHQPNDYQNEMNNVDLVLSGHTHGGQLFPLGYIGTTIGSNDETYGLHQRGNTSFIVNSGISNWALSFKTGTKSEYVIIDIIKNA